MHSGSIITAKKTKLTVITVLLALMMIGSFADYAISCSLFNLNNPFGIFLAAYGEYPATLGLAASGSLLAFSGRGKSALNTVPRILVGIVLMPFGTFMACFMPTIYLSMEPVIVYAIGFALSIVVILLSRRLAILNDPAKVRRIALILILVIFAEMILVNLIKIPWGRARMRLVATDSRAYFMPWWQVGGSLKHELTALGVASEEFKSFPSGHTANAAVLLLLPLLADLEPKLKGKGKTLLIIGAVWAALVAFSRIIMGAHYLSDTVVGCTVNYLVILIILKLLYHPVETR